MYKSYIIFSERCTLRRINIVSSNIKVIKRNQLNNAIRTDIRNLPKLLTTEGIDQLYPNLQKYAHAGAQIKETHIDNI